MPLVCSSTDVTQVLNGFKTMSYEKTNKLFYGVELEVEVSNRAGLTEANIKNNKPALNLNEVSKIVEDNLNKNAILKQESTVNYGFEIVTIPATLDYHRCMLWGDMFEKAKNMMEGRANCGMHIHFSRNALTDKQLAKTIYFMHETENSGFVSKIAGRRVYAGASWCNQRKKVYVNDESTDNRIIAEENGTRTAISISRRFQGKSVEVRIFRSNPTKSGVLQGLEFVDSIIRYCGECGNKDSDLTYKAYLDWYKRKFMQQQYPTYHDNLLRLDIIDKPVRGVAVFTNSKISKKA